MLLETPAFAAQETIILLRLCEPAEPKPYLDGVDARIWRGQAGIRDMHEAHFRAPVILAPGKMQSQRA